MTIATIHKYDTALTCTWCEKEEVEGVLASFENGFLEEAPLCWRCFTNAVKVDQKQNARQSPARNSPLDPK